MAIIVVCYSIPCNRVCDMQVSLLVCSAIPQWYKSLLFNELYYVSDGGTVWLDPVLDETGGAGKEELLPLIKEYGKFAYLEGTLRCFDWK